MNAEKVVTDLYLELVEKINSLNLEEEDELAVWQGLWEEIDEKIDKLEPDEGEIDTDDLG